jgi:hypothetical protein
LSTKSVNQLFVLEKFYDKHRLRYGTGLDIFISPQSIERRRVVRLLAKVIKLAQIEMAKQ